MAPVGTLWTTPAQNKGTIIKAAASFGGVGLTLPANYEHFVTNLTPEFTAKFPHGKIPAFEGADGFKLFEAAPIARYIASLAPNSGLLGHSTEDAALVDQWIHFVESEIDSHVDNIRLVVSGKIPYNKPTHTLLTDRQTRSLKTLEAYLVNHTFLVGERITLADLYVAGLIQKAVAITIDAEERKKLPNVIRHLETVVNQPKVKDVFGPTNYTEKAIQYTPPKKEAKPAPAAQPKAEKKPKAKEPEDDDDDEPAVPAEPKAKNPLDDLPKSTFNLEDWKRAYSNKETRGPGGALEWFYQNYDPAGFSVWRVDFKYNDELTQVFMSSNQIGGFFNRLEASRKYLFGSVGVLGEANNSAISGALILRGQDVLPVVEVAPDYESYAYKKLDLDNAEDKGFFEAALAWDLELDGKKWADGKNFK